MFTSSLERAVLVITLCAPAAWAQVRRSNAAETVPRWPASATVTGIQMRPTGDFGQNVGFGYGAEGVGTIGLDPWGILKFRGAFGGVWYGNESRRVPLSPTIGGRITVKLVTDNAMYYGNAGPEITVPWGPVRPYANIGLGFLYFTTNSHIEDNDDSESRFSTNNFHDATSAQNEGVGVRISLGRHHHVPVLLDLGASRTFGGQARYLRPGGIADLPDGSLLITPFESNIHFTTWRLGVTIGR